MGIFTRFRDIVNSNINGMLDRAEDPEKLIRLMIHEMEDTLIEIKAASAGVMANIRKIARQAEGARDRAGYWAEKAEQAVYKGREDLARQALIEKRKHSKQVEFLENELAEHATVIGHPVGRLTQWENGYLAGDKRQGQKRSVADEYDINPFIMI